jgi:adenylate cyclase class 2
MERIPADRSLEIETKIRIISPDTVKKRLHDLNIPCAGIEKQQDVYYTSPWHDFGHTDEALRLRHSGGEMILTYKGPRLHTHGFKAREELNVRVDSGENMEKILQYLGFIPVRIVKKRRERYEWAGAEISLDEVEHLGTFVEIEIKEGGGNAEERIERIKKELGIEGEHILLSYLELLLRENEDRSEYPSPLH